MPVRVLIVEDSNLIRQSICSMLKTSPEFQVVGEAHDGFQAVGKSEVLRPDVILLDVSMPNLSGLGAVPRILEVSPESRILMFSSYDDSTIVTAALDAGALGHMAKCDAGRELLAALRATSDGEQFFSSRLAAARSVPVAEFDKLVSALGLTRDTCVGSEGLRSGKCSEQLCARMPYKRLSRFSETFSPPPISPISRKVGFFNSHAC